MDIIIIYSYDLPVIPSHRLWAVEVFRPSIRCRQAVNRHTTTTNRLTAMLITTPTSLSVHSRAVHREMRAKVAVLLTVAVGAPPSISVSGDPIQAIVTSVDFYVHRQVERHRSRPLRGQERRRVFTHRIPAVALRGQFRRNQRPDHQRTHHRCDRSYRLYKPLPFPAPIGRRPLSSLPEPVGFQAEFLLIDASVADFDHQKAFTVTLFVDTDRFPVLSHRLSPEPTLAHRNRRRASFCLDSGLLRPFFGSPSPSTCSPLWALPFPALFAVGRAASPKSHSGAIPVPVRSGDLSDMVCHGWADPHTI